MADEIIRMQDIYAEDIVGNINEVREARGTFESLDARLDNIGGGNAPSPSTSDPAMDGTAFPGSADTYSRGDHVHPTDMSRQAVIDSSHKLSSDLVDDTNNTHKFATAAQLQQISTNENNILLLSPTAYTAPRPNTNYNITIDSGGYFLCGKICYINVRLTVGTDIPNNTYFLYDLPEALTPLIAGSSICALNNNRGVYISVASQGNVLNASGAAITAGQLLLTGAYLIK